MNFIGIWTLLQRGEEIGEHDLSLAEPTYCHMSLYELHKRNILKYVVSQNCDGLHLRSGLPRFSLSEVHGNMYVEVCKHCKPSTEYWRIFDTTPLTSRFQHKTNRRCRICANPLVDTIVHFGERGSLKWPLNWNGATKAIDKADVILCLGSSLKVLKKYPWLWALDKPQKQRPKVYIVNLQWTPKDSIASIKINGKCDEVMEIVMKYLNIEVPIYNRAEDPIFHHASLLKEEELHTASQPMLKRFSLKQDEEEDDDFNENDETTNSVTFSSDKHTPSTESDQDSKSQSAESAQNFIGIIKNEKDVESSDMKITRNDEMFDSDVKIKFETSGSVEATYENGKIISIKEDVKEILDLTAEDSDDQTNTSSTKILKTELKNEVIDFEELIDNLEVKIINKSESTNSIKVDDEPIKIEQTIKTEVTKEEEPKKIEAVKINDTKVANIILQQNQNLIDMALLNNSLLTASLAFAPAGSTSKEALTATALILNYNNQIISTLTNNLNLLPYTNGSSTNGTINTSHARSSNCDKSNVISNQLFENDIEMIEQSDDDYNNDSIDDDSTSSTIRNEMIRPPQINENPEQYYKQLFASYCKAINDNLPKWSDVNYAYSGLHTIVNLPPEDANLWKSDDDDEAQQKKKLRSSTATERKAAKADCKFCYDKYEAMECQFYKPINREFKITTYRNGKLIICECCDFTDDDEDDEEQNNEDEISKLNSTNEDKEKHSTNMIRAKAGWFGKGMYYFIDSCVSFMLMNFIFIYILFLGYRKIQKKRKKIST